MARGAQQAFAARAGVAPRISDNPGAHRQQMPVGIGADGVLQRHRVALDVMLRGLRARQDGFHRTAQQERRHRRLRLNRQLFLGAEGAAAGGERDFHLLGWQVQHSGNLTLVEDRPLALRVYLDAVPLRQGQTRFRFEKRRLDGLRDERLLDDMRRCGQRGIHVAAGKGGGLD